MKTTTQTVSRDERVAVTARMATMTGEQAAKVVRGATFAVLGESAIRCDFTVATMARTDLAIDAMVAAVLREAAKHGKAHAVLAAIAAAL